MRGAMYLADLVWFKRRLLENHHFSGISYIHLFGEELFFGKIEGVASHPKNLREG